MGMRAQEYGAGQLQAWPEMGRVSTARQETAAGLKKGLGQGKGLGGGIAEGDSFLEFISSSQRREGIVFPSGGACPYGLLAQPVLMLTVHSPKPAAHH